MRILMMPEKMYKKLVNIVDCKMCKHYDNYKKCEKDVYKIPEGICLGCCMTVSADTGAVPPRFEWPDSVRVVDLR